jgi:hypothetical protein
MRPRLGLTAVAVLLGLFAPATAGAVTVPEAVSFPPTKTGAASAVTVTFAAEDDAELMDAAVVEGDPAFTLGEDTCSSQEVVGACTIAVRFAPTAVGERSATLRLAGARGDAAVQLTGTGYLAGAMLAVSPAVLTFQPLSPGLLSRPQRVTVTAGGDLPAQIAGVSFEGPAPDAFVVTQDGCTRTVLVPGSSCALEVRSSPFGSGQSVARLRLLTVPADASQVVGLVALGFAAPGPPPPTGGGGGGGGVVLPPWSIGILAAGHASHKTTVRLYTNFPARVTVTVQRGRRAVLRGSRRVSVGFVRIVIRGRLRRGRYTVRIVAARGSQHRRDSFRLRVR